MKLFLSLFLLLPLLACLGGQGSVAQDSTDNPFAPGATFRDCDDCPEMVVVPPGLFVMGLGGTTKAEKPKHRVFIRKAFAIGRFEVTFDQWQACRTADVCQHDPDDHEWGQGSRPVINVTFEHVENYLRWLSATTNQSYRLPSEAEWEYAHRGGTTTTFPWGDDLGENLANCKDCKSQWSAHSTTEVGQFAANNFGLYDTVGNAFEWTGDCWNPNHENAPKDGSTRIDGDCDQRVMRGGSFYYFSKVARSSYRAKNLMEVKSYWLGFRVVRELP